MVNTKLAQAIKLATGAHDGQVDKIGLPYILHPLRVMLKGQTEEERIVGVLHDVVEDTYVTVSIINQFFGPEIAEAVNAITFNAGAETRDEYYARVKANPLALTVKLHDVNDNLSRLDGLDDETRDRLVSKYTHALEVLWG